jgi:predicted component of type VI protein secretion system
MPFKLKVSKPSPPPPWYHEYEFQKNAITIGREAKSDLQLEGINSVVSRQHAQIIRKGDGYVLLDLHSRNSTFLNGDKIKPGIEHKLQEGDKIRICDYEIELSLDKDQEAEEPQKEPAEAGKPNAFLEGFSEMAKILDRLSSAYEIDGSPHKKDALNEAIEKGFRDTRRGKVTEIFASHLEVPRGTPTFPLRRETADLDILANYDRISKILDALVEFLVKLIQARLQFKMEFLGETIVKLKSFSLDNCTAESLKDFMFDPTISRAEAEKRVALVATVLEELLVHQFSLLEGYKSGINEGTKQFLERMNPARIRKQVNSDKARLGFLDVPYRYLPLLKVFRLVASYSEVYGELTSEDQAYIEQRYFRPAFKQGYYRCTRAPRGRKPGPGK